MKRGIKLGILAALLALAMVSCETMPWTGASSGPIAEAPPSEEAVLDAPATDSGGVSPSTQALAPGPPRFGDVPVPSGVDEDAKRTYVYESPSIRLGRLVYTSKASVNELVRFYSTEGPKAGWEMLNAITAGDADVEFKKPGKRLKVSIRDEGRERTLEVNLTPESEGNL